MYTTPLPMYQPRPTVLDSRTIAERRRSTIVVLPRAGRGNGSPVSEGDRKDEDWARPPGAGRATVFVIHGDARVRNWIGRMGQSIGWDVDQYASAESFLRRFDPTVPGCLVVDVHLPGMGGLELQRELAARQFVVPVVFVTTCTDIPTAVRACKAGAVDFIEDPDSGERVLDAMRRAIAVDRSRRAQWNGCRGLAVRAAQLTTREWQVMDGVVAGKTSREIATELGIRLRTVEGHRARLMKKLRVDSVAALTRLAVTLDTALDAEVAEPDPGAQSAMAGLPDPPDWVPPGPLNGSVEPAGSRSDAGGPDGRTRFRRSTK